MKLFSTFLLTLSTLLFANEGEALFNAKCRVCHGIDLHTMPLPLLLDGTSKKPYMPFKVIKVRNTADVLKALWKA